jgi:hypothetical protein
MQTLRMQKSNWAGSQWPSIDFDLYEHTDFLVVVVQICQAFALKIPAIVETLDGYMTDLDINGDSVSVLLDNWTFSLATQTTSLRDNIFDALKLMMR